MNRIMILMLSALLLFWEKPSALLLDKTGDWPVTDVRSQSLNGTEVIIAAVKECTEISVLNGKFDDSGTFEEWDSDSVQYSAVLEKYELCRIIAELPESEAEQCLRIVVDGEEHF